MNFLTVYTTLCVKDSLSEKHFHVTKRLNDAKYNVRLCDLNDIII